MRKSLLSFSLLAGTVIFSFYSSAQVADKFAYAVTDMQQGYNWNYLRKLNLQNGTFSDVILNGADLKQVAYDAATKQEITSYVNPKGMGFNTQPAFSSGVAAMALDIKNNRLYFTPMFIDQLRYVDLKTMKAYYVTDQDFSGRPQKSPDQGNIITRMVIASDGYGYAVTNDGTQLLRFGTGKKLLIEDLGSLVDDQANNGVSIHNSCSSYGGDVIADDDGSIYIFTARNYVFKINTESKVAKYLGTINGLPVTFTTNGAAVTADNKIIVSSAMASGSYFTVDLKSLTATPYIISGTVWQSSDLANSNLYLSGNKTSVTPVELMKGATVTNVGDGKASLYPNPVINNQFAIQFNSLEAGSYTVYVTDVMGRQLVQQAVNLSGDNQIQVIKLDPSASKGIYLVSVTDEKRKSVFSTKLVVQ
ncbi:MAG: T9SS type A sorting domain-containing protein [Chitinophagaceae bacterium]|nr:T9SS type A sorting domain-containing protein [Chitinophagaceae bacterium]MBK8951082.1 T9SS type A sorting domain-containing protein [Chitinophagaceae bacterium]